MLGSQWDVCIPLINRPYEKSHIALVPISHNAPVQYPTMCHFVTEMCIYVHISVTKWCIVGYLSGALWDFWSETGLFCMKFRAWSHYWSIIYSQILCHWRGPRWPCIYNIFHIYIYIWVSEQDHQRFMWWLLACSEPNHHLNQGWLIVNWIHRNKLQWHFYLKYILL